MMIAMQVPRLGARFAPVERPVPAPGVGELLIQVHACGICHSDGLTVDGLLPGVQYPRVPAAKSSAPSRVLDPTFGVGPSVIAPALLAGCCLARANLAPRRRSTEHAPGAWLKTHFPGPR
jgi:hypothetical protein